MITRGSKYFYGAAVVGYVTALLYGFITGAAEHGGVFEVFRSGGVVDSIVGPISFGWKGWVGEHIGYSILMGFAGTMLALGGFCSAFRDGSAEAVLDLHGHDADTADLAAVPGLRITTPRGLSYWPIATAFAIAALVVGAAVSSTLFVIGCIGLVVTTVEWTVRSWSERATGDPALNREIRNRFMHPLEIPIGAALGIALLVFSMSRILLAISQWGAVFFIIILASAVFAAAILLASRPQLKRSVLVGLLLVAGLGIIGGGIAGAIAGPRHSEEGMATQAGVELEAPALERGPDGGAPSAGSIDFGGLAVGH